MLKGFGEIRSVTVTGPADAEESDMQMLKLLGKMCLLHSAMSPQMAVPY